MGGGTTQYRWSRKDEEYVADFYLVSKRTLAPEEWDIFRFHFLLGADWRLCCRRLNMSRGNFFHAIYRIEEKLGRTFKELEPYALFPLDEYFGGYVNNANWEEPVLDFECDEVVKPGKRVIPIRPPLRKETVAIPEKVAA